MDRRTVASLAAVAFFAYRAWRRRVGRFALAGCVVAISGGSRGLGLQIAREAAARGARLALLARSPVELDAAAAELRAHGTTVSTAVCDVRSDADVRDAFARVVAELGEIDVLVACAGIIGVGAVDALELSDYRDAIETNFLGVVRAVEAVRPSMQRRRSGRIVAISSIGGIVPVPMLLAYCASKFAVRGYAEGLRTELARDGIAVTTVCPGPMRTGSPPHAIFSGRPELEYVLFAPLDALPLFATSVARAARTILDAVERGEALVVLSRQAQLLARLYAVAPRAVLALETFAGGFVPRADGRHDRRPGYASAALANAVGVGGIGRDRSDAQHELLDRDQRRS